MKLDVLSQDSAKQNIQISDEIFSNEFNSDLVHQVVTSFLSGARQGSHSQKNRSDVRGGGKKPYRQKGTGRALSLIHI